MVSAAALPTVASMHHIFGLIGWKMGDMWALTLDDLYDSEGNITYLQNEYVT